ncbi:hypothetical protein TW95_gp1552 [Pandoravirus inopinatum]|uniref:Uncharacterized protein n=1 Tax=Pandoravirus inopinatum TaxID=1605721 RepID=A0A0B5JBA6_9VIRU|nr:hypothetical protein TW95_gp1552 [Pandoravirus inopinatum]AJF98286.1 hypothetical protein [Pandoravirus inopinatum]
MRPPFDDPIPCDDTQEWPPPIFCDGRNSLALVCACVSLGLSFFACQKKRQKIFPRDQRRRLCQKRRREQKPVVANRCRLGVAWRAPTAIPMHPLFFSCNDDIRVPILAFRSTLPR